MRTCLVTVTFLFLGHHIQAQVDGPVRFMAQADHIPKTSRLFDLIRYPVLLHDDRMYTFIGDPDKKTEGGRKWLVHAYSVEADRSVASSELVLPTWGKGEDLRVRVVFMAGERPAALYRIWSKKTGLVTLHAQALDPATLENDGAPVNIGEIPFDARSYLGDGPYMTVTPSPDGSKLLFYFDKIKLQGFQLVMCWVTSKDLEPIWSGVYRVPAQSAGFQATMKFADDAAVYLSVEAVLLSEDDVKEKQDGSLKAKEKANYHNKKEQTFFKLRGEEFRMWDGALPNGWGLQSGDLTVAGGQLYVGGLALAPDGKRASHWAYAQLDGSFQPGDLKTYLLPAGDHKDLSFKHLILDDSGDKYFIAMDRKRMMVKALDARDVHRWDGTLGLDDWGFAVAFVHNGKLRIGRMCQHDQVGHETSGELKTIGAGFYYPVLVTFDERGRTRQETLVRKEDGGRRGNFVLNTDISLIQRAGFFFEHTNDDIKDRSGIVMVPVR